MRKSFDTKFKVLVRGMKHTPFVYCLLCLLVLSCQPCVSCQVPTKFLQPPMLFTIPWAVEVHCIAYYIDGQVTGNSTWSKSKS